MMKFKCYKCGWEIHYDFQSVHLDGCKYCGDNLELVSG